MTYILIIALIVIGVMVGVGCKIGTTNNKTEVVTNTSNLNSAIYSKSEIEKKLKKLAKSKPKNLESMGAMCYEMAMPPERSEYICTKCGEKTIYTNSQSQFIAWYLPVCRDLAKELSVVDGHLDESQYCKSCSPNVENPQLCLTVKLKDATEHKTCNIDREDLKVLKEFLNDEIVHIDEYDAQTPLNYYLPRIEILLGIDIEEK